MEKTKMNNARIERMLRELHAGPPLRFFEDIFALRDIVASLVTEIRNTHVPGDGMAEIAEPALAAVAGASSSR
ncbi:MAG TPA: hypothetical protein VN782_05405 [Usitatibacter sp.]|nr:hypothetical protein [Usitatibacter sp.]